MMRIKRTSGRGIAIVEIGLQTESSRILILRIHRTYYHSNSFCEMHTYRDAGTDGSRWERVRSGLWAGWSTPPSGIAATVVVFAAPHDGQRCCGKHNTSKKHLTPPVL
ncbi:hypothetical protein AVEN_68585-1 [Araneus ventricosus]|uniref:Uncharacterized protein n=1 Tax=Araneus ventricosus TaxID=182803 RepID=A0A4Y2FFM2_ARAVE|nr:hypothetical protein AVEN_68585-1 [Araneus ventricosus]